MTAVLALEQQVGRLATMPSSDDLEHYAEDLAEKATPWRSWLNAWHAARHLLDDTDLPAGFEFGERNSFASRSGDSFVGASAWIASRWQGVPRVFLDATPPPASMLEATASMIGAGTFDVVRAEAPHQHLDLIVGAPTSRTALQKKGNIKAVARSIWRDIIRHDHDPARVLVVSHKPITADLAARLPKAVTLRHYGSLAGSDAFGEFEAAYLIGAPIMGSNEAEAIAEQLHQKDIAHADLERPEVLVETRDSRKVAVAEWHHPVPRADEVLIDARNRELIQAAGRLRGVNRTPDNPCRLVVVADAVVPLEVDVVVTWETWSAAPFDVMAEAGFMPTGFRIAYALWPRLFEGEDEAKRWCEAKPDEYERAMAHSLIDKPFKGDGTRSVHIRAAGSEKWSEALAHPGLTAADVERLTGVAVEFRADRPATVAAVIERHGFCPTSYRHAHRLASDLWPTARAAESDLSRLEPVEGEELIVYRLPGRGRQVDTLAVARAGVTAEEIVGALSNEYLRADQ